MKRKDKVIDKLNSELTMYRSFGDTENQVVFHHKNVVIRCSSCESKHVGKNGEHCVALLLDNSAWFNSNHAPSTKRFRERLTRAINTTNLDVVHGSSDTLLSYVADVSSQSSTTLFTNVDSSTLYIYAPSWDFSPDVTKAMLDEEFKRDPVVAERDFGSSTNIMLNGTVD